MKDASKIWTWLPWVLVIPAYFANLGLMPLWADEPTRAVVAWEMSFYQEFIVPTINSNFYLNKPPLYNWIMLVFYDLFGFTEWATRLPAMMSLIGMSVLMYWGFKPEVGKKQALAAAFLYITFGRMVYYSSHLGHIDPFYSDLVFFNFIFIYRSFQDKKYLQLFLGSYFIMALAFLMKGLPTLAFQAFTLLALFINGKQFMKLLGWKHILGILLFSGILGGYFYLYFQDGVTPLRYWENLLDQNVTRTAVAKSTWTTIKHVFYFPIDQMYLFTPWFTLVPFLFQKKLWRDMWRQPFLRFTLLVIAVNLPLYWLSPDNRPRYLFMLYPFIFLWMVRGYFLFAEKMKFFRIVAHVLWIVLPLVLGIGIWYATTLEALDPVSNLYLKVAVLSAGWIALSIAAIRTKEPLRIANRFFIMVSVLLVFKLAVQWIVLPYRYYEDETVYYKTAAQKVGEITRGSDLYLLEGSPYNHSMTWYTSLERNEPIQYILPENFREFAEESPEYFILSENQREEWPNSEVLYSFRVPYRDMPTLLMRSGGSGKE